LQEGEDRAGALGERKRTGLRRVLRRYKKSLALAEYSSCKKNYPKKLFRVVVLL